MLAPVENRGWDGTWTGKAKHTDETLEFEIKIPFETLLKVGLNRDSLLVNVGKTGELKYGQKSYSFWKNISSKLYTIKYTDLKPKQENYTIRLHFAELDEVTVGERVFDIKIQDTLAEANLDIYSESGGKNSALSKEYKGIDATGTLIIEFIPKGKDPEKQKPPIVNGVEIIAE